MNYTYRKGARDMTAAQKKRLIVLLSVFAAAGTAALLIVCLGIKLPCPFRLLTGLNCPGCGNTRAAAALFRLRFAQSIRYNYAYPFEYLYLLRVISGVCRNYYRTGRFSYYPKHPAVDWTFLALLIVWWVARNALGV